MKELSVKAYAKVNLALDVLGKRDDGYHNVKMVMQNIGLFDDLTYIYDEEKTDNADGFTIGITTDNDNIPTDERNLIYKAIKYIFEKYNIKGSMSVVLKKNIPVEAGMAGGSTDCAASIKAVNELCELGLNIQDMMDIGVKLGADVPYCILAKTAISEGIGEVLTEIKSLPDCYILVAKPPVSVSTGMVYNNLKCDELISHPDVDGMVEALREGNLQDVADKMENVLETVTVKLHPEISDIKKIMISMGALNAIMSGSGPTVFGLYNDEEEAKAAKAYILKKGYTQEVYITKPV
ncbi:MAG: 4-(cytidine 5'-diphospho)-2-C-methyl-D-erythritol kinase [Lachnospiraceae bacterium]|nr:4-(cytidine 5'-diphospho)-2-C-methyl-D-erythritol kinase [Lachnospiraceae bacterium]